LKLLLTFKTIGAAFDFQKAMKNKQLQKSTFKNNRFLNVDIIPTPRCLGVGCSYSAVIEYQEAASLFDFLKNNAVEYSKIYQITVDDKDREIYKLYNS
jgi:hypothetical protein